MSQDEEIARLKQALREIVSLQDRPFDNVIAKFNDAAKIARSVLEQ